MAKTAMKSYSLAEMKDKYIGKKGTKDRVKNNTCNSFDNKANAQQKYCCINKCSKDSFSIMNNLF